MVLILGESVWGGDGGMRLVVNDCLGVGVASDTAREDICLFFIS